MNIPFRYAYISSDQGIVSDDHCGEGNIGMHAGEGIFFIPTWGSTMHDTDDCVIFALMLTCRGQNIDPRKYVFKGARHFFDACIFQSNKRIRLSL